MSQISEEDFGIIRFISVPASGAPLQIRERWIGVEVPCLFCQGDASNEEDKLYDVETGCEVERYPGYTVFQAHAIEALQRKAPEAAEYWIESGFPLYDTATFYFSLDSAEVLKPVMTRDEFWQRFGE